MGKESSYSFRYKKRFWLNFIKTNQILLEWKPLQIMLEAKNRQLN